MSDTTTNFSARQRVVQFVADWWRSRDPQLFYRGVPALLLGVLLGGCIAFSQTLSPSELAARYRLQAKRAWALGNLNAADLYYRKALTERTDDLDTLMESALLTHRLGQQSRSAALVSRMMDDFQHPPAFLIRAEGLLQDITTDSVSEAASLIEQAAALDQESTYTLELDGMLRKLAGGYEMLGDRSKALTHLNAIASKTSQDRLSLGHVLRALGKQDEAKAEVERLLASDEGLSHVDKARAYAVLGKRQEARDQLGSARASARLYPEELRKALVASVVCFQTLVVAEATGNELPLVFLEDIAAERAIAAELAQTVFTLAGRLPSAVLSEVNVEALDSALASSQAPMMAHLLKGLLTFEDHFKESAFHLRFAHQVNPASSFLLSQGCLLLAKTDLPVATQLHVLAMDLTENHWFTIQVHGELLLAAEAWQATVDLLTEHASEEHPVFYRQLAQAYEQLGDSVRAKENQDRLNALQKKEGLVQ